MHHGKGTPLLRPDLHKTSKSHNFSSNINHLLRRMQAPTSLFQHLTQLPTLLIQILRRRPNLEPTSRRNLKHFTRYVAVPQHTLKRLNQALHWRQQTFCFDHVVKGARGDGRADDVRVHGVEGDVFFGEVFAVGADEAGDRAVYGDDRVSKRAGNKLPHQQLESFLDLLLRCRVDRQSGHAVESANGGYATD